MNFAETFNNWVDKTFPQETMSQWVFAIPTFILSYILIVMVFKGALSFVTKNKSRQRWFEFVHAFLKTTHWPFFIAFSVYASMMSSPISSDYKIWFNRVFGVAIIIQVGFWLNTAISWFFQDILAREADASKTTVLRALRILTRLGLWISMLLLILDNMGVNITTLVAGLGIGGIAVALGVQKIVGDIFASLSIVMDRPFVIGDFIIVGELKGTVEDIGIKTTRIRSLDGESLVFSNSDLLESRIRNFARIENRRVNVEIGVTYETPVEKIQLATKIIEDAVKSEPNTLFEFAHFTKFADFSLNIEVAYRVYESEYPNFAATREKISLAILEGFNKNGIDFAYPTQRQYYDPASLEKLAGR